MNSGNINVGKYTLDCRQATKEEQEWIKEMNKSVKGTGMGFDSNTDCYYSFNNFKVDSCNYRVLNNYPLITISELKVRYNRNKIYELW